MTPTREMIDHFDIRTAEHILRVQRYAKQLLSQFPELAEMERNVRVHDQSKYLPPEYRPYLFISWKYRCKAKNIEFDIPADAEEQMHNATTHHVLTNKHHPEYWSDNKNPINKNDRDEPAELIDATQMPDYALAEMVADWSSMAEEYGQPGPYKWADDNINTRWKFNPEQIALIYKYIDFLWS